LTCGLSGGISIVRTKVPTQDRKKVLNRAPDGRRMKENSLPKSFEEMIGYLRSLHAARRETIASRKALLGAARRPSPTSRERGEIFAKTGGRCHLCGGDSGGGKLVADHVFAHAAGGEHAIHNYLAAHGLCNRYRWHYSPEELQLILKLGVWARKQMEDGTPIGENIFAAISKRVITNHKRTKRGCPGG
jgi:hypothetical protein